ncbi:hypothetical protein EW146_g4091 [Bondarzewia mesenterica]|uniref:Uncharacterized protein n=1 Tax=Bondarzewia mesenterica TaxID=1095465 RepID=A0A4S4M1E6_9AGAM|nr:hypothetical protein EW146_g4091 [Bondarzewia mesenterica]
MPNNYVFSLQPTFTQGLILGQLSILILLSLILKYLFLDSTPGRTHERSSYPPRDASVAAASLHQRKGSHEVRSDDRVPDGAPESTEWFNAMLHQVRRDIRHTSLHSICDTDQNYGMISWAQRETRCRGSGWRNSRTGSGRLDFWSVASHLVALTRSKFTRSTWGSQLRDYQTRARDL